MSKVEKFVKLVKDKFDIELDIDSFHRTYAGYWQRKAGAWSWWMYKKGSNEDVGSQTSITKLLNDRKTLAFDGKYFD